jgi:cysteine-rich repeat protein
MPALSLFLTACSVGVDDYGFGFGVLTWEASDHGATSGEPDAEGAGTSGTGPTDTNEGAQPHEDPGRFIGAPRPECGNGEVEAGEECDDGNHDDHDGCHSDCTLPGCNDGVIDPGTMCHVQGPTLPVSSEPRALVATDMDGDNDSDLVVAAGGSHTVQVLLFGPGGDPIGQHTALANTHPAAMAVGDLDGDNAPDVVVANPDDAIVSRLLNDGTGRLGPADAVLSQIIPGPVALGHLDLDGKLDLLSTRVAYGGALPVLDAYHKLSMHSGHGDGTFLQQGLLSLGERSNALRLQDMNADGIPDLIVAYDSEARVEILVGNGSDDYSLSGFINVAGAPSDLDLADVDANGTHDVVITSEANSDLTVLRGDGAGHFSSARTSLLAHPATALAIADLDADGVLDAAVADSSGNLVLLSGDDAGAFDPEATVPLGGVAADLAIADLDGDGIPDILASLPDLDLVQVVSSRP